MWVLSVAAEPDLAEALAYLWTTETGLTAEVQDPQTMTRFAGARAVLRVEEAPDEVLPLVRACMGRLGLGAAPIETREETDTDWQVGWRAFFKPCRLSPRVGVRPPWADPGEPIEVIIEPGMAFGTGTHATTRAVMRCLDGLLGDRAETQILDVGCGSAVLSIAAALLGHRAIGVEIDPVALENARENRARNGVEDRVELIVGSADAVEGQYPIVVANILAHVLIDIAPAITARVGGDLILSGLLEAQEPEVLAAYPGLELVARDDEGPWRVLHLRR